MQKSLKSELLDAAKRAYPGNLDIESVEAICHLVNRKVDNATRRLRELMHSGMIEAVRDGKGLIIGYRHKPSEPVKPAAQPEQAALFRPRQRNY